MKKSLSLLLSLCLLEQTALGSHMPADNRPAASTALIETVTASIPESTALIAETYDTGSDQPPVLIIQDVHLNVEAQRNIVSLLRKGLNDGWIADIATEGAFDDFNFQPFRALPDQESVRLLSNAWLSNARMSAPSYIGLTTKTARVFGVDDKKHYDRNVSAFLRSRRHQNERLRTIAHLMRPLEENKEFFLSPSLKNFERVRRRHRRKEITTAAYLKELSDYNRLMEKPLKQLVTAIELEQNLDFEQIKQERLMLLKSLSTSRRKQPINLTLYPHTARYVRYRAIGRRLNGRAILSGLERLEETIVNRKAVNGLQKDLINKTRFFELAQKLVRFELTPEEWEKYKKLRVRNNEIIYLLAGFEEFYQRADIRSYLMAQNLLKKRKSKPNAATAFVAGGFHTALMTDIFRNKKIPYVVITPKISDLDGKPNAYLRALATHYASSVHPGWTHIGIDNEPTRLAYEEASHGNIPDIRHESSFAPGAAMALITFPGEALDKLISWYIPAKKPKPSIFKDLSRLSFYPWVAVITVVAIVEGAIGGHFAYENSTSLLFTFSWFGILWELHLLGIVRWVPPYRQELRADAGDEAVKKDGNPSDFGRFQYTALRPNRWRLYFRPYVVASLISSSSLFGQLAAYVGANYTTTLVVAIAPHLFLSVGGAFYARWAHQPLLPKTLRKQMVDWLDPGRSERFKEAAQENKDAANAVVTNRLTGLRNSRFLPRLLESVKGTNGTGEAKHLYWQLPKPKLNNEGLPEEDSGLLFIDMNNFKFIEQTWGQEVGDRVAIHVANTLKLTATALAKKYRDTNHQYLDITVVRYKDRGDEFLVAIKEHINGSRENRMTCAEIAAEFLKEAKKNFGVYDISDTLSPINRFVSVSGVVALNTLEADNLLNSAKLLDKGLTAFQAGIDQKDVKGTFKIIGLDELEKIFSADLAKKIIAQSYSAAGNNTINIFEVLDILRNKLKLAPPITTKNMDELPDVPGPIEGTSVIVRNGHEPVGFRRGIARFFADSLNPTESVHPIRRSTSRWEELAATDPLTKLGNREASEVALARLNGKGQATIVVLGLEKFAAVNKYTELGHEQGDIEIVEASRVILNAAMSFGLEKRSVFRRNGAKFMVIVEGVNHQERAYQILELANQLYGLGTGPRMNSAHGGIRLVETKGGQFIPLMLKGGVGETFDVADQKFKTVKEGQDEWSPETGVPAAPVELNKTMQPLLILKAGT